MSFTKPTSRRLIAGIVLLVVILRASIPIGFMPGAGGQLTLCHDGMHMPAGTDHPHSHYEHCPFGGGPSPAPAPALTASALSVIVEQMEVTRVEPVTVSTRLVYLPQSRGPPTLA